MKTTLTKEQKSAISLLLASKFFERLAFYMVMAVLITYLTESLNLKHDNAGMYYSLFYGVVALTTFLSGFWGDLRNRSVIVTTGFVLFTLMYLAIAFMPEIGFLILIVLIVMALGIGLVSPNIPVFLGNIYNEKDREIRGLPGFILLSLLVNIGAFAAPLIAVPFKTGYGYNFVFLVSFLFGLISLIFFILFNNVYRRLNLVAEQNVDITDVSVKKTNRRILLIVLIIGILYKFVFGQKGLTLPNEPYSNLTTISMIVLVSIIVLVLFAFIVIKCLNLKWSKIFNMIIFALGLGSLTYFLIAGLASIPDLSGIKPFEITPFVTGTYLLVVIAESMIAPVISYSVYRSSPFKRKGLFQGIFYIVLGIGGLLTSLGAMLHRENYILAFIVFAILMLIGTGIMYLTKSYFRFAE